MFKNFFKEKTSDFYSFTDCIRFYLRNDKSCCFSFANKDL